MARKYGPAPRQPRKPRPGADCFTAFGAILTWNARRAHWTVRRGGQIVGTDNDLERAMTVARETAKQG
jgi:hypothetical protein